MASTKLSAEDKKAIVKLYQEIGQTAATVAERYGVSVSTISRLLKIELPPEVYEALVRQKRGGSETKSKKRTSRKKPVSKLKKEAAEPTAAVQEVLEAAVDEPAVADVEIEASESDEEEKAPRSHRRRTRSSSEKKRPISRRKSKEAEVEKAVVPETAAEEDVTIEGVTPEIVKLEAAVKSAETAEVKETSTDQKKPIRRTRPRLKRATEVEEVAEEAHVDAVDAAETPEVADEEELVESKPKRRTRRRTRSRAVAEELPEVVEAEEEEEEAEAFVETTDDSDELELDDLAESLDGEDEDEDEDFDDAFDDDDLDDEDDASDNITSLPRRSSGADVVQIQPLSEANLSRMLYLVIDRTADLITMPMVFFSDLGELPEEEEKKKTLPVFENHRVARRFSQRNQRVIKVPDGELLSKTASWLEAKGITRCLLDGQVYSLESVDN